MTGPAIERDDSPFERGDATRLIMAAFMVVAKARPDASVSATIHQGMRALLGLGVTELEVGTALRLMDYTIDELLANCGSPQPHPPHALDADTMCPGVNRVAEVPL